MTSRFFPDYETLSPYLLLRRLRELARNQLPDDIRKACEPTVPKPWQLLEEGVFFFFRQVLMLHTIRLGANCLFKQEPEGFVLVNCEDNPFALIYECKARSRGYKMSSDDVLRYKRYIKQKRQRVREYYNLRLTHLLVVSSSFAGNISNRVDDIGCDGTVLCLVPAAHITTICGIVGTLPYPETKLLQLHRLFCRGILTEDHICETMPWHRWTTGADAA